MVQGKHPESHKRQAHGAHMSPDEDLWLSALRTAVTKPPWKESVTYRNSLLRG